MRPSFGPGHLMALATLAGGLWAVTGGGRAAAEAGPWQLPAADRAAVPFPRAVADTAVLRPPQRVVAASVFAAEVLVPLASQRLAGITFLAADARYSTVAAAAAALPVVGQSPEQLLSARPDLVVLDQFTSADVLALLAAVGVPVVRTRAVRGYADVIDNVRRLGFACDLDAAAEAQVQELERRRGALRRRAPELAGWRIMNLNGDLDTYGRGSLFDAAVAACGAVNLPAQNGVGGYQKLDAETVLGWQPDALVVGVEPGDGGSEWLRQHPGLRLLPCVQQPRVIEVPSALLGTTSPRAIEVAERLQQALLAWGPR